MHSKTAVIDGVWSTVGSTNLDWRSFLDNDEINAVILGREFGQKMQAMFARDLEASQAIDLETLETPAAFFPLQGMDGADLGAIALDRLSVAPGLSPPGLPETL